MLTKCYRQLTHTGDPYVDIEIPETLYQQLVRYAQYNARELKAEMIARLTQMMHYQRQQFEAGQMAQDILVRLQQVA